jgi:tetratricopeptide (TPR) repeat protein
VKRWIPAALCLMVGVAPVHGAETPAGKDAKPAASAATTAKPASAPAKPGGKPAAAPTDSLVILEKQVARDSTKFDPLYRLGVLYLDRDRARDAVTVFSKAAKLRPKYHRVLVNLGAAYDATGNGEAAQEQYRAALVVAPDDSVAMCRLASSLYAQNKHTEALDMIRDIIVKRPGSYCAYFTLGVAFADAGIYRDAIRMWKKVVELAPESPEAASAKESIEVLEKFVSQK